MVPWKDVVGDAWSSVSNMVIGYGGGVGEYKGSYVVKEGEGVLLNGVISAELQVGEWRAKDLDIGYSRSASAGLVCRADELWTFLTMYVAPSEEDPGASILRLAAFKQGTFFGIASSEEKMYLGDAFNQFSLEFFSGSVKARIVTPKDTHELSYVCPHVPFPGYVGLVKFHGTYVVAREICVKKFVGMGQMNSEGHKDGNKYQYDAFICHSTGDKESVLRIVTRLKEEGISYWVDHERIGFGDSIVEKIEEGLRESRHVLVVLSSALGRSKWCRAEYGPILQREFNRETGRKVIPLMLDDCRDDDIPILLYDRRRVEYRRPSEFGELMRYLKHG